MAVHPDPVVTAPELAERLEYTADGIRNRLHELEGEGFVKSREVGARATVWWITTDGREELP
ncbi:MarR family transcriptional regulator [Haloarcula pellucida]|uniref:MarR family transcriptional regulator n=1 Tax=Haloarcula pellucida TaxID=1427151 RepID=UPI003CCBB087